MRTVYAHACDWTRDYSHQTYRSPGSTLMNGKSGDTSTAQSSRSKTGRSPSISQMTYPVTSLPKKPENSPHG